MGRTKGSGALEAAILVARAGCARVGRAISMGSVTAALGLMLSLGGCSQSHQNLPDLDGDGYTQATDCNDEVADIHPGAFEPDCADGIDQDCDGVDGLEGLICNFFPEEDLDGDGFPRGVDCNDSDPTIYPGAPEDFCTTVDNNCDGVLGPVTDEPIAVNCFFDNDGDGYGEGFGPGPDCNDDDPTIHPGADEPPCPDGIDQNCDGVDGDPAARCDLRTDADGDGFPVGEDCDDTRSYVFPGAWEDCMDGIDNDCDDVVDEAPPEGCFFLNGMLDVDELDEDPWSAPPNASA